MRRALAIVLVLVATSLGVVSISVTDGDAQSATRSEPLVVGQVREIRVAGTNGVPSDALAVTLNVTAAGPDADGYLTVYPCGESVPTASNLNFRRFEEAVPNAVMVRVGTGGKICLVSSASTSVVVDVAGYVPAGSTLTPLPAPRRLLDTREGLGAPAGLSGPGVLVLEVAGREGVPATARAAVLNVTVVGPAGPGYATVFPCDQPRPEASNVNFVAGDIRPNLVLAGLDPQGRTCIFTTQPTHLVVDATASTGAGAGLRLVANPERVLDTRSGLGAPAGPVGLGEFVAVQIAGRAGVPTGATSVVLNVTTTGSTRAGFVTAYPCGTRPNASNLNHAAGQTVANLVVGRLDDAGRICLFTNVGSHLVADVAGWFEGSTAHQVLAPIRLYDSRAVPTSPPLLPVPQPIPAPLPTVSFPPPPVSLVFATTTTSSTSTTTTATVPYVPIDTDAPCDLLVFPIRNGSIRLLDLITGEEFAATDSWFVDGQMPVVTRDCTGLLVAGPGTGAPNTSSVRFYRFDGAAFSLGGVVPSPLGSPTMITELDDGRVLASVGPWTWDASTGDVFFVPTSSIFLVTAGIALDGSVVVLEPGHRVDHDLYVYDPADGQLLLTTPLPTHGYDTALSPDGTWIAIETYSIDSTDPSWPYRTPTVLTLDGTLIESYPLGEQFGSMKLRWVSDTQLLVCANRRAMLWTIGGDVIDLGVTAVVETCPSIG